MEPAVPSPRLFGYRAGAKLSLALAGREPLIGVYETGTHRVVDISRCRLHHPLINKGIAALKAALSKVPDLLSRGAGGQGELRYASFTVSEAGSALHLALVARTARYAGLLSSLAAHLSDRVSELGSVSLNVNPSLGNEIFGEEWTLLTGGLPFEERFGGAAVLATPAVFLQANRALAAAAYAEALERLAPLKDERLLDLYCGVGGFAFTFAPHVARVDGVEVNPCSVENAALAAQKSGQAHLFFHQGLVEEKLAELLERVGGAELAALNPARKGATPEALKLLSRFGPRAVAYLSCNPETLARDAHLLCGMGYGVASVKPYDFLPHTDHIETLAIFLRK